MSDTMELLRLAQIAGEERLRLATDLLFHEEESDEYHVANDILLGPYCGCDTCVVREVIDAAWPFIIEYMYEHMKDEPDGPR